MMDTSDDEFREMAKLLRQKNERGFDILVRKYLPLIKNAAFRRLANEQDTEDVCHDVLVKIFSKCADWEFTNEARLRSLLREMTTNMAIDFYRKAARRCVPLPPDSADGKLSVELQLIERLQNESMRAELHRALADLNAEFRGPVMLYYFDDLSHREIAERLEISEVASRQLVFRGLAMLRDKLMPAALDFIR